MSRLSEAIKLHKTREERFIHRPFKYVATNSVVGETGDFINPDRAVKYQVEATFRTTLFVSEAARRNGGLEQQFDHARRQITHEVFGEYVPPLHEAIHAIHNYDMEKAERILHAVLASFDDPSPYKDPE